MDLLWSGDAENPRMVEINLLPWRIYLREYQRKKMLQYTIGSLIGMACLFFITHWRLDCQLQAERHIVMHLQKQLLVIDQSPARQHDDGNATMQRLLVQFQHNQQNVVEFFNQLMQLVPEELTLQKLVSQDEQVLLIGCAASFQALLDFVRSFNEKSDHFHAEIVKIKTLPQSDLLQFSVQFLQVIFPLSSVMEKKS